MRVWKTPIVALALTCAPLTAARADDNQVVPKGTPYAEARAALLKRGMATAPDPNAAGPLTRKQRAERIKAGFRAWKAVPPFNPKFRELDCEDTADGSACTAYFLDKDKAGWRYYVVVSVDPKDGRVTDAHYGYNIEGFAPIPPPLSADIPHLAHDYLKARKTLKAQGFTPSRPRDRKDAFNSVCANSSCRHYVRLPELMCSGTGLGFCTTYWISPDGRVLYVKTQGEFPGLYYMAWSTRKAMREDLFRK